MIKARHDHFFYPFFRVYSRWLIRRNFHEVLVKSSVIPTDRAVLLLANHVSWWDGFWALYLNTTVFHKRFHFMMLEKQLRKYWYFNRCGGFSVQKHSRSVLESLDYASALLQDPENLVLLFPQGEIRSQLQSDIHFEKGVERILEISKPGKVQVIFLVSLTDYFSFKKPVLTFYLEEYNSLDVAALKPAFIDFYKRCQKHQSNLAE